MFGILPYRASPSGHQIGGRRDAQRLNGEPA